MAEIRRIAAATQLLGDAEYLLLARDWRRDVWELTAHLKDRRAPFVPQNFRDLEDAKRRSQVIATELGVRVINVVAS
jgi:hypothetical protein